MMNDGYRKVTLATKCHLLTGNYKGQDPKGQCLCTHTDECHFDDMEREMLSHHSRVKRARQRNLEEYQARESM